MILPHTKLLNISASVQYMLYTAHQNKQIYAYAQDPVVHHHQYQHQHNHHH
jgi:hypothetical protein